MHIIERLIPENIRNTFYLRYFGLTKIPLLFYVRPSVVEKSDERVVIKIPLNRKSKNHQGSMYFAALTMGADCAARGRTHQPTKGKYFFYFQRVQC